MEQPPPTSIIAGYVSAEALDDLAARTGPPRLGARPLEARMDALARFARDDKRGLARHLLFPGLLMPGDVEAAAAAYRAAVQRVLDEAAARLAEGDRAAADAVLEAALRQCASGNMPRPAVAATWVYGHRMESGRGGIVLLGDLVAEYEAAVWPERERARLEAVAKELVTGRGVPPDLAVRLLLAAPGADGNA